MDIFVILVVTLFAYVKSDIGLSERYNAARFNGPAPSYGPPPSGPFPSGSLHGDHYKTPITSYDAPSGSVLNLDRDRQYYHVQNHVIPTGNLILTTPSTLLHHPTGNFLPTSPSPLLQQPIHEHTSFTGTTGNHPSRVEVLETLPLSVPKVDLRSYEHETSSQTHDSSDNVEKHLYFYSAPDEPEEVRPRVIAPPPVKKNVKILFIKAPTFKQAPIHIPAQQQNQEKTLVYVLVKKPEESEQIVLPTAEPTKPAKPEVFFIKYKTQKEADQAISKVQSEHADADKSFNVISNVQSLHQSSNIGLNENDNLVNVESPYLQSKSNFAGYPSFDSTGLPRSSVEYTENLSLQGHGSADGGSVVSSTVPTLISGHSAGIGVHDVYGAPY